MVAWRVAAVSEGSELEGAQLHRQESREEVRVLGAGAGELNVGTREHEERKRLNGDKPMQLHRFNREHSDAIY
jgi:hypothetical protein